MRAWFRLHLIGIAAVLAACAGSGLQAPFRAPDVAAQSREAVSRTASSGGQQFLYAVECCGLFNNGDVNVYANALDKFIRRMVRGAGDAAAIAVDRSDTFYLLSSGQGFYTGIEVNEWDQGAKTPSRTVKGFLWADAIAVDGSGDLYVADCNTCPDGDLRRTTVHDSIFIYRPRQTKIWRTITQGLRSPRSMAVDAKGYLYVANVPNASEKAPPSIAVYAPGANVPLKVVTQGLTQPALLTTDNSGNLFVANGGLAILEYSPQLGTRMRTIVEQVDNPTGMALDASGTLYVANSYRFPENGWISVYASGTSRLSYVVADGIDNPVAVAVSGAGELFVANDHWGLPQSKGNITVYAPSARAPLRLVQGGRFGLPTELALYSI